MQGGHGECRIPALMFAGQRDAVSVQRLGDEFQRRAFFIRLFFQYDARFVVLRRGQRRFSFDENACLFRGDGAKRVAKPFHVIEADRSDHAHIRRHSGGGIESAAHAGFEHDDLACAFAKPTHRQCERDLEKSRMHFHFLADFTQRGEHVGAVLLGDFHTAHFDALAKINEMRRSEQASAAAAGASNAVDHRADAAFAIGACDVDHLHAMSRIGEELLEQMPGIVQA